MLALPGAARRWEPKRLRLRAPHFRGYTRGFRSARLETGNTRTATMTRLLTGFI
jgi:hypothetical protein